MRDHRIYRAEGKGRKGRWSQWIPLYPVLGVGAVISLAGMGIGQRIRMRRMR